jgi:hypothetical protein
MQDSLVWQNTYTELHSSWYPIKDQVLVQKSLSESCPLLTLNVTESYNVSVTVWDED